MHRAGADDGRRGAGLPHQVGTDPRSVRAGRFQRHRGPSPGDAIERAAGRAVHHRRTSRRGSRSPASWWRVRRRTVTRCPSSRARRDRSRGIRTLPTTPSAFTPISVLATRSDGIVAVGSTRPAGRVDEQFVALARQKPGELNTPPPGVRRVHAVLGAELFSSRPASIFCACRSTVPAPGDDRRNRRGRSPRSPRCRRSSTTDPGRLRPSAWARSTQRHVAGPPDHDPAA